MEYQYAVERGKPVIGFVFEDPSQLANKLVEQKPARVKKLDAFRELVKSRLCKYYSSPADLGAKVSRSITQLKKQYPTPGWVRADVLESLASADEVLALRKENDELRQRLTAYGLEEPKAREMLASGTEKYKLEFVFVREAESADTGRFRKVAEEWANVLLAWDLMFSRIGPTMLKNTNSYWSPAGTLAALCELQGRRALERKYPAERFKQFRVSQECVNTILLQLRALRLIELDDEKNWCLTPYGDNYLVTLLGVPKGQTAAGG